MSRDIVYLRANGSSSRVSKDPAADEGFKKEVGPVLPRLDDEIETIKTASPGPTGLNITSDISSSNNTVTYVAASWTPSTDTNVVEYRVTFARLDAAPPGGVAVSSNVQTVDNVAASFEPAEAGAWYEVTVQNVYANNTVGSQLLQGTHQAKADDTPPGSVSGFSLGTGIGSVTVAWDENTESDMVFGKGRYRVQISDDNTISNVVEDVTVTALVTSFFNLQSDGSKQYWVAVSGVDFSGNEGPAEIQPTVTEGTATFEQSNETWTSTAHGLTNGDSINFTAASYPVGDTASFSQSNNQWTSASSHNLSVNDIITFTASDANPSEYLTDTPYYVLSTPSSVAFTLSDSLGGNPVVGTVDSGASWTYLVHADPTQYSIGTEYFVVEALVDSFKLSETLNGTPVDGTINSNSDWYWQTRGLIPNQVTGDAIADLAITNAKIADASIDTAKINSLSADKIITGSLQGETITVNTGGKIESADYVEGDSGWSIGYGGVAEFNDATLRGSLNSGSIFIPNPSSPVFSVQTNGNMTAADASLAGTLYMTDPDAIISTIDPTVSRNAAGATGGQRIQIEANSNEIQFFNDGDNGPLTGEEPNASVLFDDMSADFDSTTDTWFSDTAHFLEVDDTVTFLGRGVLNEFNNPASYSLNVTYYVVAVPTTESFQLSTTQGGAVLAGGIDSEDSWTYGGGRFRISGNFGQFEIRQSLSGGDDPWRTFAMSSGRAEMFTTFWARGTEKPFGNTAPGIPAPAFQDTNINNSIIIQDNRAYSAGDGLPNGVPSTPNGGLAFYHPNNGLANSGMVIRPSNTVSNRLLFGGQSGPGISFCDIQAGTVYYAALSNTSDIDLKEETGEALGLDFLNRLYAFSGRWKQEAFDELGIKPEDSTHQFLSAQSMRDALQAEAPGEDSLMVTENENGRLGYSANELLPVLVKAIHQLTERLEILESNG